ncbi:MAG TPA: hypothetical protein VLX91_02210 [Candidatus Acidoferrales bacterium]|nr:hypothetical protein [Candidatus Acidoferrales bacterium]
MESEGLGKALDNHKDIIITRGNGQKRIDDLISSHDNVVKSNSSQIASETQLQDRTAEKNDAVKSVKDAVALVDEAAKSAFEDDPAKQKEFRIGAVKPKSDEGWVTYMDYMTGPVHMNSDALIANGMTADDVANFPMLYANLVAAIAAQKNAAKVRNAATKTRDAAVRALGKKITTTRNFAKAAFKGNAAALEEIKPIKIPRGRSAKPAPPVPEPPTSPEK